MISIQHGVSESFWKFLAHICNVVTYGLGLKNPVNC